MRFYWLWLRAWLRGIRHPWPIIVSVPEGYQTLHVSLPKMSDMRGMYEQGWEPWIFQRHNDYISKTFRMENTEEEEEYNRFAEEAMKRQAEEYEDEYGYED